MVSFGHYPPAFVLATCSTGFGRSEKVRHVSSLEWFQSVLSTLDGEESLHAGDASHFWNQIVNEG